MHWPLPLLALLYTFANGLFFTAYHTDFSKVKHAKHGGKELSWLYIFERVGSALGPVVGGILAGVFSPQISMIFALLIILASLAPLFMTREPVKTQQEVSYRDLDIPKIIIKDSVPIGALNLVNIAHVVFWPLFLAVFVFVNGTYELLGIIVGISTVVSIISTRLFGKFIDKHRGTSLLKYGVWSTMLVNIARIFAIHPSTAVVLSATAEPSELAAKIALVKAYYDETDKHDNHRIAYIALMEQIIALYKAIFLALAWVLFNVFEERVSFQILFAVAAVISIVMLKQKFTALKEKP